MNLYTGGGATAGITLGGTNCSIGDQACIVAASTSVTVSILAPGTVSLVHGMYSDKTLTIVGNS